MITRKETYGNDTEFWFDWDVWVRIEVAPDYILTLDGGGWEYQEGEDEDTYWAGNWWCDEDDPKYVIDYDGISELPRAVIQALEDLGYNCDEIK